MTLLAVLQYLLYQKLRRSSDRLQQDNQQLQHQSLRDPLTALFNRRALMQKMDRLARQAMGRARTDLFLLIDIDHFKQLNDQYGHAVGDAVLIEVGKRLQQICRDSDLLVRWGGEEFLLYLPDTNIAAVPVLAQRLLNAISAIPVTVETLQLPITLTGGVASTCYPDHISTLSQWQQVVQLADAALYNGKQQGRNRICCISQLPLPLHETLLKLADSAGATDHEP